MYGLREEWQGGARSCVKQRFTGTFRIAQVGGQTWEDIAS